MEPIPTSALKKSELFPHLVKQPGDKAELIVAIHFEYSGEAISASCGIGLCAKILNGRHVLHYEAAYAPIGELDSPDQVATWLAYDTLGDDLKARIANQQDLGQSTAQTELWLEKLALRKEIWNRLLEGRRNRSEVANEVYTILNELNAAGWNVNVIATQTDLSELNTFLDATGLEVVDAADNTKTTIPTSRFRFLRSQLVLADLDQHVIGLCAGIGCNPVPFSVVADRASIYLGNSMLDKACELVGAWEAVTGYCDKMLKAGSATERNNWRRVLLRLVAVKKPSKKNEIEGSKRDWNRYLCITVLGLVAFYFGLVIEH